MFYIPVLSINSTETFLFGFKQLTVTEASTIIPPTTDNFPGSSPIVKNTHRGFKSGSTREIKVDSKAVIFLMALAYRT